MYVWHRLPIWHRDRCEAFEQGAVTVDVQAEIHRVDAEVRGAGLFPGGDVPLPVLLAGAEGIDPRVDADLLRIATDRFGRLAEQLQFRVLGAVDRTHREPAIAEPGGALDRDLGRAADPDRDRPLDRQWIEPGLGDGVEFAAEGDDRLGPEAAEQLDLLLLAPPAGAEVLAERLVLDRVPADADPEPELAGGQDIDLSRLLGDERGLPLGQDHDARNQ